MSDPFHWSSGYGDDLILAPCHAKLPPEPEADLEWYPELLRKVKYLGLGVVSARSFSTRNAEWAFEEIDYAEEREPDLLRGARHFDSLSMLEPFRLVEEKK